ncbi:MAG: FAD-dependent oxidoreductase [Burkholderiales bacterium]
MPNHKPYDALIVGGGHNGLTCACYPAGAGYRVRVLERRAVVGGAAVIRAKGTHTFFATQKRCASRLLSQNGGLPASAAFHFQDDRRRECAGLTRGRPSGIIPP